MRHQQLIAAHQQADSAYDTLIGVMMAHRQAHWQAAIATAWDAHLPDIEQLQLCYAENGLEVQAAADPKRVEAFLNHLTKLMDTPATDLRAFSRQQLLRRSQMHATVEQLKPLEAELLDLQQQARDTYEQAQLAARDLVGALLDDLCDRLPSARTLRFDGRLPASVEDAQGRTLAARDGQRAELLAALSIYGPHSDALLQLGDREQWRQLLAGRGLRFADEQACA